MEDEAKDALDILKTTRAKEAEKLLKEQENTRIASQTQQQKFVNDVVSYIDSLKDINGISLSNAEKQRLVDFALTPGSDNKTKYVVEYNKNLVKNFVNSAFYTMSGDKLTNRLNKKAESEATLALKKKLELSTKRGKGNNSRMDDNDNEGSRDYSTLTRVSGLLSKPQF